VRQLKQRADDAEALVAQNKEQVEAVSRLLRADMAKELKQPNAGSFGTVSRSRSDPLYSESPQPSQLPSRSINQHEVWGGSPVAAGRWVRRLRGWTVLGLCGYP
jgi:hypothetical protein